MSTHRISLADPDSWPATWDTHAPGDRIVLDGGVYPDPLDCYETTIRGGMSWGGRTRIEARVRTVKGKRVADKVVLKPSGGDFVLRLASEQNSFIQIGTAEAPFEIDASGLRTRDEAGNHVPATGIKVTHSGAGCAHHVTIYARVHHAYHQGVLVTDTHHVELYGSSRDNGWNTSDPAAANKDHGVYLGAGAWNCKVFMDTSGNAAYGAIENTEHPGTLGRNVFGGFHLNNGRLAKRSGILLAGDDSTALRVTSSGNQYGVHVYHTARRCKYSGFLEGNRDGRAYVDPAAVDCVEVPL